MNSAILPTRSPVTRSLSVGGLFAGIGGIELGLSRAGHREAFLCESDPWAQNVLRLRFPGARIFPDVRLLAQSVLAVEDIPRIDVLAGGFPCQDLSQAGQTKGITGAKSGLVEHMFSILKGLDGRGEGPTWVVIENVANMLRLDGGLAMRVLTQRFEDLGYRWAYRLIDTMAFGLPQRRHRVWMIASKIEDPRQVLFAEDHGSPPDTSDWRSAGFYWSEGLRGVGWAPSAVPTIKGGSGLGIPTPPAVWTPEIVGADGEVPEFGTITIRDAERLQGFSEDWTLVREGEETNHSVISEGARWRMVGNAVTVDVAQWIGENLKDPKTPICEFSAWSGGRWPDAAWGGPGLETQQAHVSKWPVDVPLIPLEEFLRHGLKPLSLRAATGFRGRTMESSLRFENGFLDGLDGYIRDLVGQG